jgi:hypothetical protein
MKSDMDRPPDRETVRALRTRSAQGDGWFMTDFLPYFVEDDMT